MHRYLYIEKASSCLSIIASFPLAAEEGGSKVLWQVVPKNSLILIPGATNFCQTIFFGLNLYVFWQRSQLYLQNFDLSRFFEGREIKF